MFREVMKRPQLVGLMFRSSVTPYEGMQATAYSRG